MGIVTAIFIYVLIWWVLLFTVLPFGITRHRESDKGYDAGAPAKANMKKKLLINTLVSAVLLGIIQILLITGVLDWSALLEGTWK